MGCPRWTVVAALLLLAVPSLLAESSEAPDDEQPQPPADVAAEGQATSGASSMHDDERTGEQTPVASQQEQADETWAKAEALQTSETYGCGETWETCDAKRTDDDDDK
ncbi:uncharacterized protein LOC119463613 [Dermacentor silvarum]|uniref:uncharacterized protein LOC119463613 n=1 Tax=Dermacentor silvarum TaxID=543639 RepID=UPI00189ABC7A|nr:uncharacterized protein LOC119463613 [Dermacentor silvarum]